jgi:hypothetical protein
METTPRSIDESVPQAVTFASEELDRCLRRLRSDAVPAIRLCLLEEIDETDLLAGGNRRLDDVILVEVERGAGIIAGSNPRSVLIGVYRYLFELGFRWPRPGLANESIPPAEAYERPVQIRERAANRHRGICIEGAVSVENVLDMIDWAPKLGFNAYFTQFRDSHAFFERWYDHLDNPLCKTSRLTRGQSQAYLNRIRTEIARRDLVYHAVGHGWTCEPLGIASTGWHPGDVQALVAADRALLAQVDGVRGFFHGIPLNTHLCYSQPDARRRMVENLVDYARANPDVHIVHFWLADDYNNLCECVDCRGERLADLYIRMLNDLDARLTEEGLPTRIVFLIYLELLWPPEKERILHPDRFLLMFAPISRTYDCAFLTDQEMLDPAALPPLPPFERNRIALPKDVRQNLSYLAAWKAVFQGDSFVFDYPLMWEVSRDPGGVGLARVIHSDVGALPRLMLHGMVSCQQQRVFFPTGLPMYVMGRALWDMSLTHGILQAEYLDAAFGPDACLALDYLAGFPPGGYRDPDAVQAHAEHYQSILEERHRLASAAGTEDPAARIRARSLLLLVRHAAIQSRLGRLFARKTAGETFADLQADWEALMRTVWSQEEELQPDLDVFEFQQVIGSLLQMDGS